VLTLDECVSFSPSNLFGVLLAEMDKLNENARQRKQIKLGEIDTGPIIVALLLGFIAVGESATWSSPFAPGSLT